MRHREGDLRILLSLPEPCHDRRIERGMIPLTGAASKHLHSRAPNNLPIPQALIDASRGRHVRAYETKAGAIIWDFDTTPEFQTVNGMKAHGGSIVSMAPVVAGGTLYMTSGYSGNAMPGNVLLAFTVDGK